MERQCASTERIILHCVSNVKRCSAGWRASERTTQGQHRRLRRNHLVANGRSGLAGVDAEDPLCGCRSAWDSLCMAAARWV